MCIAEGSLTWRITPKGVPEATTRRVPKWSKESPTAVRTEGKEEEKKKRREKSRSKRRDKRQERKVKREERRAKIEHRREYKI